MKILEWNISRSLAGRGLLASALLWGVGAAWAQTVHVSTAGSDIDGDGSIGNPFLTISNGVALAPAGSTVLVADGVYTQLVYIYITNAIVLRGMNAPTGAVITTMYPDPANSTRCIRVNNAGAVVDGLTVQNGYPPGSDYSGRGGGIYLQAGIITNCLIRHCHARLDGGGIYATGAYSIVTDCQVVSNETLSSSTWGGGGAAVWYDAQLLNSRIATNVSINGNGGGVDCRGSVISNCHVLDNWITGANIYGGGIRVRYGGTVSDCVISNNYSAVHAGGIYYSNATSMLANCTITCNRAIVGGGGVLALSGCELLVTNCVIEGNQANYGTGVANNVKTVIYAAITVTHSRVSANTNTGGEGGGMFFQDNHGLVESCVIVSNVVPVQNRGGGIFVHNNYSADAHLTVRNCLIAGNRGSGSASYGGGVYIGTGKVTMASCTIADNESVHGGGIAVSNDMREGNLAAWNIIAVSNLMDGVGQSDLSLPADHLTNAFYYSCSPGLANTEQGNITAAPEFADYAAGDYRLAAQSPAINAGTNQEWMTGATDLDGRVRVDRFSGRTDMGCYEYLLRGTIFVLQ